MLTKLVEIHQKHLTMAISMSMLAWENECGSYSGLPALTNK